MLTLFGPFFVSVDFRIYGNGYLIRLFFRSPEIVYFRYRNTVTVTEKSRHWFELLSSCSTNARFQAVFSARLQLTESVYFAQSGAHFSMFSCLMNNSTKEQLVVRRKYHWKEG